MATKTDGVAKTNEIYKIIPAAFCPRKIALFLVSRYRSNRAVAVSVARYDLYLVCKEKYDIKIHG